jgi:hypothetical protein
VPAGASNDQVVVHPSQKPGGEALVQ